MVPHPQATADLVTIIKEILNGKLYFFVQRDTHTQKPYVLLRISPYSVRMWENTEEKNSEYGHFSGSDTSSL